MRNLIIRLEHSEYHPDFPWRTYEDGRFREGNTSLANALRSQPDALVSTASFEKHLDQLKELVEGRLTDVEPSTMDAIYSAHGYTFWRDKGGDRWYAVTRDGEPSPAGGSYRSLKYLLEVKGLSRTDVQAGLATAGVEEAR